MKAPNDAVEPGVAVLDQSMDLQGSITAYAEGTLQVQPVAHNTVDWWKARNPFLAKPSITNLAIVSQARTTELPNEIMRGNYAAWMGGSCEQDTIEAEFSLTVNDDAAKEIKKITAQSFNHKCHVTDLPSGTYRSITEFTPGEPMPTDLHIYLYEASSVLHYDGTIVLTDEECPGTINVGNVLNITGSRVECQTMNALIESVVMDLDSRATAIQIGPPKHLGFADMITLLQSTRRRMRYTPIAARTTGQGGGFGAIQMPDRSARENTQQTQPKVDRYVIGDPSAGRIDINKADTFGKEIKLRELLYCDNGVEKKILSMASELYT